MCLSFSPLPPPPPPMWNWPWESWSLSPKGGLMWGCVRVGGYVKVLLTQCPKTFDCLINKYSISSFTPSVPFLMSVPVISRTGCSRITMCFISWILGTGRSVWHVEIHQSVLTLNPPPYTAPYMFLIPVNQGQHEFFPWCSVSTTTCCGWSVCSHQHPQPFQPICQYKQARKTNLRMNLCYRNIMSGRHIVPSATHTSVSVADGTMVQQLF